MVCMSSLRCLKEYYPDHEFNSIRKPLHKTFDSTLTDLSNYVYIGNYLYLDSTDTDALLEFVSDGNNAFISSWDISYNLMSQLLVDWYDLEIIEDSTFCLDFFHPDLSQSGTFELTYYYDSEVMMKALSYIDSFILLDSTNNLVELGYFEPQYLNFIMLPHGKGAFYLHTTPIAFSNLNLVERSGLAYSEKVFAHLSPGDIYFDEYSRPQKVEFSSSGGSGSSPRNFQTSPLSYILSQDSLKWAWWLLGLTVIAFIVFRAKRRQRIIPVLESNSNTSLEFIETIGNLYYQQNDHKKLVKQKMKHFLAFIRNRYQIATNQEEEVIISKIVQKSQIPEKDVSSIFKQASAIQGVAMVSSDTLIFFHQSMERFYQNCK